MTIAEMQKKARIIMLIHKLLFFFFYSINYMQYHVIYSIIKYNVYNVK